jgi:integrase
VHLFNFRKTYEARIRILPGLRRTSEIRFLPENNARLRYLSLEECALLIESCKAPHLRAIVTIALHAEMRSGEIRSLQWRDLDFDTGFLIVRDSKNGETRHVPMDSIIVALLRNWPRTEGSEFVFTNAAGGRIEWLQHGFRAALGTPDSAISTFPT